MCLAALTAFSSPGAHVKALTQAGFKLKVRLLMGACLRWPCTLTGGNAQHRIFHKGMLFRHGRVVVRLVQLYTPSSVDATNYAGTLMAPEWLGALCRGTGRGVTLTPLPAVTASVVTLIANEHAELGAQQLTALTASLGHLMTFEKGPRE